MSSFRKNFTKLASGAVIAQIIGLLSSPIVTRLYTPDDYGVMGLYIAISTILIMISTGRYHLAIVLPTEESEAINLLVLSSMMALMTAVISFPIFYYFNDDITSHLNAKELSSYLWLIPVSIAVRGVFLSLQYWHTRNKQFGAISIANISESASGSAAIITAGIVFGSSIYGLIGGRILSACISSYYLASKTFVSEFKEARSMVSLKKIKVVATQYIKFPLVSSWAALLNTIAYVGPILLLSFYFNPVAVGLYTLADRVVISPLTIIGNALSQIIYQKSSEIHNTKKEFGSLISNITNKLFTLAFYPAVLIAIFGQNIFTFMFGDNWNDAGIYAQILSLYALSRFVVAPLINICLVHNKQETELYFNIILSICRLSSIIIGGVYNNIYLGLALLSLSSAIAYGILLSWLYKLNKNSVMLFIKNSMLVIISFMPLIIFSLYIKIYYNNILIIGFSMVLSLLLYVITLYKLDDSLFKSIFMKKNNASEQS